MKEFDGGYSDWRRQATPAAGAPKSGETKPKAAKPKAERAAKPRRLNNKERTELAGLPDRIEALEEEKSALETKMASPEFYRADGAEIAAAQERHQALESEIETAMERWEELEAIANP